MKIVADLKITAYFIHSTNPKSKRKWKYPNRIQKMNNKISPFCIYSKEKQTIYSRLPCVDTGTLRRVFDVLSIKAQ